MKRILSIWILLCGLIAANAQTGFGLLIEDSAAVSVCNNIVVNNADGEVNISLSAFNLTQAVSGLFMDAQGDFRLSNHSPAINAGDNGCAVGQEDLDGHPRVVNETVDLGAYEYPVEARAPQYAVHQTETGQLQLCNNIIVNNPEHTAMTNLTAVSGNNILSDSVQVFQDAIIHFGLWSHSPAVDAGSNGCLSLPVDIDAHARAQGNAIDVGAFEFTVNTDTVTVQAYTVFQDSAVVSLCNNIIINNCVYSENTNVADVSYNIVTDVDTLFTDNMDDYTPRPESEAVNAGNNACNSVEKDLDGHERISGGTIEIGAFELAEEEEGVFGPAYAVHQIKHHTLLLCNNIIVNNPEHEAETNIGNVPGNNILSDSIPLFCDAMLNFKPTEHSPAVDAGDNSCSSWATDIDTVTRITNGTIDIGAFEVPKREPQDSTWAGGGGDGGAGGGGGSGGGTWYGGYAITSVVQTSPDTLTLCNNIIINNSVFSPNTNVSADSSNILTDQDSLFTDNRDDYMPRPESQAVNRGNNSCNEVAVDLAKNPRIFADTIDIGAFEQFELDTTAFGSTYAVHIVGSHNLTLCNNIIVNNPEHEAMVNAESVPASNLLSDSVQVFVDAILNFNLWSHSPAVDAGDNSCNTLSLDICDKDRVIHDTIDVGAFEFYTETFAVDTVYAVSQSADTAEIYLCNNIIINNCDWALNANVSALSTHNILEDNDTLFEHNRDNYMPRENSIAVNQGNNECCALPVDLFKHPRIMADTIEIGAFELYEDIPDTFICYPVHQTDTTHTLYLYNNIVINNPGHTGSTGGHISGDHNMLEDTPDVFVNEQNNYALRQLSPAIDGGDNQWATWPVDLKDDPRIACASIVDQGAYEYSFSDFELTLSAIEVATDNCQGYYFDLTATPGALHYHWSHSNEDTNAVQVSPLIPTEYAVIVSNGGECIDTATVMVVPSSMMADSLGAPASMGTTFWLSYLRNHFHNPTLTLNISAEEACTGTVSNPRTGWSVNFSVGDHSVTTVSVPLAQAYSQQAGVAGDYGLLVETTDTVSVYAANYNTSSFDVTDVLPVDALSNEYVLQTYTPMMNAEFVIVATEDSTWVDITPSRALQGGHPAQQTYSVMLQQGQTYLGVSQYGGVLGDLSGTVIHAHGNKPVAVFNGNVCALVPTDNSYTDHLVEQAIGVNYWGRSFSITTTESQNFDVVRVTALRNNTEIRRNGTLIATLQAYQTHEFQLTGGDGSCYLETSEPAGVYLYIAGAVQGNSQERSDPSMVWIPPTEQMLTNITFATFNSPGISDHYVNIVVPADAVSDVTLDGVNIGGQFTLLNGSSDFAFVRKHINNGTHTLHCDGGFIAHCYGLGYHESYGYAAGSKAVPLKEQLFVNGILNTELPPDTKFCPYEPIEFSTYVNYPCDSVLWNFGDGSPLQNAPSVEHDYAVAGNYTVSATLYITSNGVVFCSNLYARVKVVDGPTITFHDTVCQGQVYAMHGFEVTADEAGHFTYTRTATAEGQYCDSTFVLELEVRENHLMVEDTICLGNSYQAYGFHFTPIETGLYTDTINAGTAADGCDSLVILQLMVTPNTDIPPTIEGEGWPCQGGTYTYAIDSLSGLQEVVWTVPDSVIVLPQPDPYKVTLMFDTYADSFAICVMAEGGCGVLNWCRTVYPQPYSYVQIFDTLCENETEYARYGFELTNVSDSNDLFIRHDTAAGGCDSTTVLRLIFMPTYEVVDTLLLCENEYPYLYHDTLLADTGFYQIMLASEFGCDSLVNLMALSKPIHHTHFYDTVCNAKDWYDSTYTISGDYDVMLENGYGCDSLVTMHLTVYHSDTMAVDSVVCRNELPVLWNGVTFADAGTDSALLVDGHGCDSVVVMTLVVNELSDSTLIVYKLENDMPFVLNEVSYDTSGTYTQVLPNAMGCDSVLTIELTVLNNVTGAADSTVCERVLPIVWNGVTFEDAGTQFAVLEASTGADSTVVMNLTVIPTTYGTFDTTVNVNLLPIQYNDSLYSVAGTYTQHLTNAAGCDSILTLHLDVMVEVDSAVCETALPFIWNDSVFTEAGVKTTTISASTGVDSTITMTVTVIPTTYGTFDTTVNVNTLPIQYNDSLYSVAGTYTQYLTNTSGCDSILTLHIDVMIEVDSAVCETALPFTWNDSVFTEAGVKTTTILASSGADSTITMNVAVIPTTYGTVNLAVVENMLPVHYNDSTYEEAGTYTQNLTNVSGCDSVLIVVITVYENMTTAVDSTICESALPFTWNGVTFTQAETQMTLLEASTGADSAVVMTVTVIPTTYGTLDTAIVENALPFSYNDSLYSESGTYTQYLTNAAGCDSILTLHLDVMVEVDSAVCETALPFIWNDSVFTEAGVKTTTISASTGVDSTITMTVTVIPTTYGTFDTTVNVNTLPIQYNDSLYSVAGTYTQYLTNTSGCDSILTLHIDVMIEVDSAVCETALPFTWNDSVFTEAGVKTTTILASSGADSTITMNVAVIPTTYGTVNLAVVENMLPVSCNDSTYEEAGTYTQYLTNVSGCDSVLTVVITVYENMTTAVDSTICESALPFIWNGVTFTQAETQMALLEASTGADSVVVMTVTVIPTTYGTLDTAIVENALPFSYNDSLYVVAGSYTQNLTNAAGCDSILTVNLTVFPNVTSEIDSTVCESALPMTWNGIIFTEAGTDSVVLLTANGADSTVVMTLHVVALPVITHSADTVIMPGASVNLWATGADIMAWTDADGNPLSSGGNLTVTPSVTTTYYITAFNEGNSIVTNGNFESGNTGFTTAYQYDSNLWPAGNYYIGTNAHNHHSNFPNCYDHTTGSSLYMIVNGATVAGTNLWTQTVPVIPHTSYAFSAWVCTLVGGYSALAQLQFSVNATQLGEIFYSPYSTSVWNRYYEVWYSGENTTATLTILNQNTTGGGNDFGVDDIQFNPLNFCNVTDSVTVYVSGQTDSTVCADALPLLWNGVEFTAAGSQSATITASDGMDSVVVMTLHVNPLSYTTIDTAIIENTLPFSYNDSTYVEAGTYTQNLTNAAGCDSILTVNLTVFPNVTSEIDSAVCETAFPFTWNDSVFIEAGTKTTTIFAHTGADSTITMTVTMVPTTYGTMDTSIVENALPFHYNDSTYTAAGSYTQYLTNAAGCDSILILNLTVFPNVTGEDDSTICASELPLLWNGVTFTQAGTQTATLTAATGADSVVTMTLHVNALSYTTIDTAIVQNALPFHFVNGQIDTTFAVGTPPSSSGLFTYTNVLGCDSMVTLNLTVYQNVTTIVDTTVCAANLPFTWHGHSFTAAGSHAVTLLTSHGADSTVTYHLSVDNITANIGNITHITCYGESTGAATATVTGGQTPMTYQWTNASGTSVATTPSISNRPAGTYTFTVTDHLGCTATATATLNTLNGEQQPGTIAASQEVCDGEDIAPFTGTAASGGNNGGYQWQISTNGTDWTPAPGTNNAQTYTYPNSATNAFSLRRAWVSQSCGTVYSNTVTVSVWPNSSDTISASICQGEIYDEYNFNVPADQTAEAGEYTFEQHHATGHCDSAVILLLTVNPVVAELVEATVCEGEGYNANGFSVSPQETIGAGELTRVQNLQTVNGCDSIVQLTLTVIDTAIRIVPLTADFCDNMSMELMVETGMPDYEWSTGETGPTIMVTTSGYYSVTATEGGCTASAGYHVEGCHFELVLPNAITPSDFDGVNDYFALPEFFLRDIATFEIAIFNRWGEMVYYSTDKGFRWNGEYRGTIQYQTIYNYVIKYTDTAGRPYRMTGSVTVL